MTSEEQRSLAQGGFQSEALVYIQTRDAPIYVYAMNWTNLRAKLRLSTSLVCFIASTAAQTSTQFTSIASHPPGANTRQLLNNDPHLQSPTLGNLYVNSAFAHGYRHGYEQGFHVGDLDIHMGRDLRIARKLKECSQGGRDFHPSFGSKQLFEAGYDVGFRGGYADAYSGAEFRASERWNAANTGLGEVLPSARRVHFDEGVAAGYKSSQTQHAPVDNVTAEYVERYCREVSRDLYSLEYCSGFGRGYMLGIFGRSSDSVTLASSGK